VTRITHRVAAILILLFAAGHTVGSLLGRSPAPEADPVLEAMRTVHFRFNGADRTFEQIFFGFGLVMSIYLVACAFLAWRLARVGAASWPTFAALAWGLAGVQVITAIVAWKYFFAGPGLLTTAAALLLIVGNVRMARATGTDR
jgi:hypothetical protein